MLGFLWRISIYEVIPLALNCAVALAVGLVFALFPEDVQSYQVGLRDNPGRFGRWLARHYPLYGIEDRMVRSPAYVDFLRAMGYGCIFVSGTLAGFLVTYILRV